MSEVSNEQEILDGLLDAANAVKNVGGAPKDIWHPEFGWVLRDGKATESTEAFYNWLIKTEQNK